MSSLDTGASRSRQQPQETNERRLTGSVMVRQRRENGAHLKRELSAEFFTELLAVRGFEVTATGSTSFTAQRT